MYISYVKICNYRNFRSTEVDLSQNSVIVGENTVGKSNFLEALRIVLDSSLSDRDRQLQDDDFWNGDITNFPPFRGTCIEITVRLKRLDSTLRAILYDQTVPPATSSSPGDEAEISFRFEPNPKSAKDVKKAGRSDYVFNFYRRTAPQLLSETDWKNYHSLIKSMVDFRKRITFLVIPALRDIEGSLNAWRRSPLRELVERLKLEDDEQFSKVVDDLKSTTNDLRKIGVVEKLENDIKLRTTKMMKGLYDVSPCISIAPTNAIKLSQSLRMALGEKDMAPLGSTSLGIANVLYLSLLSLEAEKKRDYDKEYVILGIEEPEAHLHPHLQRLIFRDYFDLSKAINQPTLITTHSPHIASVAPLDSLVVITNYKESGSSIDSTANLINKIEPDQKNDLERYLDVTRSEILFARGVILVEGIAEQLMLPKLFKNMKVEELGIESLYENGQDETEELALEQFGITICNINGVGFIPYALFLNDLKIPFAVLTDGDPIYDDEGKLSYSGVTRGINVAKVLFPKDGVEELEQKNKEGKFNELRLLLEDLGIFINRNTFEAELILSCYSTAFKEIITELGAGLKVQQKVSDSIQTYLSFSGNGKQADEALDVILNAIERYPCFGKGRFAQMLSTKVVPGVPAYIKNCFQFIAPKVLEKGR